MHISVDMLTLGVCGMQDPSAESLFKSIQMFFLPAHIEGSELQYLNSIFGKLEILVSKWSWYTSYFSATES